MFALNTKVTSLDTNSMREASPWHATLDGAR